MSYIIWTKNNLTLSKNCPYLEFVWSVFSRIQSECQKIRTRKTPNKDTFHAMLTAQKNSWNWHIEIQWYLKICSQFRQHFKILSSFKLAHPIGTTMLKPIKKTWSLKLGKTQFEIYLEEFLKTTDCLKYSICWVISKLPFAEIFQKRCS